MSDPQRLLREGSDLERTLLGAWDAERPTDAARKRALAIGAVGTVVAVTAAGAAKGAGASLAPKALASTGAWVVKAVVATFVVASAVGAIAILRAPVTHAPAAASVPAAPSPSPSTVAPAAPVAPSSLPAIEGAPDPAIASGLHESASPNAHAGGASRAAQPPAPSASGLRAQIASLDRVRDALDAHDAPLALRRLDAYRTAYPDGALAEEADVLRIQALVQNGNRTGAESVAARFIQAHPKSPHARRIRDLLNDGSRSN